MLELKPLGIDNFQHFLSLLTERGEAPEDYYRWKYLDQPAYGCPTGFIAYVDNKPAGCIGIINRRYRANDGKDYPATWFADWFVSSSARGLGIGETLMQKVRSLAVYNFGSPGPVKAQQVCANAGYTSMRSNYEEVIVYLRPFRCGYLRGKGSLLQRFLRGVKSFMISSPAIIRLSWFESASFNKISGPDPDLLVPGYLIDSDFSICLNRTHEFVSWLSQMPAKTSSGRYWWTIHEKDFFCWGFSETDFWGLQKTTVFEVVSNRNQRVEVSIFNKTLLRNKIDAVKYISKSGLNNTIASYKYPLSVFYNGPHLPIKFVISCLDKESSWRELLMN